MPFLPLFTCSDYKKEREVPEKERETPEKRQETPHSSFTCGDEFTAGQEEKHIDLYLTNFERDDACGNFLPAVLS